jgi:hypothetical protein
LFTVSRPRSSAFSPTEKYFERFNARVQQNWKPVSVCFRSHSLFPLSTFHARIKTPAADQRGDKTDRSSERERIRTAALHSTTTKPKEPAGLLLLLRSPAAFQQLEKQQKKKARNCNEGTAHAHEQDGRRRRRRRLRFF